MQDDGVTIKTLVMVSLKKHSDPLICNRLTLVRAYSCKKSCSNNNVMGETRSQRNCVNRAGTVSEGPSHRRKNIRSGHSQTVIKLPDQERLQERLRVATVNVGTLRGRASEVAETVSRRNIDMLLAGGPLERCWYENHYWQRHSVQTILDW